MLRGYEPGCSPGETLARGALQGPDLVSKALAGGFAPELLPIV